MAISNIDRIGKGLTILREGLSAYILQELKSAYPANWCTRGVESVLDGAIGREALASDGDPEERFQKLDIQALLLIMWENWNTVFKDQLGHIGRTYVSELREVRNQWAHQQPFNPADAFRALDTMTRLLELVSGEGGDELAKISREMLRQRFESDTRRELRRSAAEIQNGVSQGLKPWRELATPHPDVASGRYQMAEFAADLFQVITGKALPEYSDPREFFQRTYLTEGLVRLLSRAWSRLSSSSGDPVVELQTNFGGGKTHSILALYHLFGGKVKAADIPGLENIIPQNATGGEQDIPVASRAVLVGTQLSPAEIRTKPDGIQVRTLWGEMAWQIGHAQGKSKEAYGIIAEEDQQGISPGSEKIARLFDAYGPVLVLIDEWVAYSRQLYGKEGLLGGTFDSNMTFAQALTEAAKAVPDAMVVAAIPQSDIEIGGEGGRAALERIKNVFGRLEAVWKPASAIESFEIVRRRLFEPVSNHSARDAVCRAYAELYQSNRAEFPAECREADYERRLVSAYPIHPELFDRLYEDWSTLERFQRTRGVLRMMASIVHELWERQDNSLMIMPGLVPLDKTDVRFEVTRYLPEGWGAVVDKDIDGSLSKPLALDRDNPNLGRYSACRRVSRSIFLGSAPSAGEQRAHGIEEVRIKLGCVQPGESPAVFGDALRRLTEELNYLYSDATRYWFDTRPTIARIASDRAAQYERRVDLVEDEIIRRVRDLIRNDRGDFVGIHAIPNDSGDVPDDTSCRLVILSPSSPHRVRSQDSPALSAAREILEQRGNSPRLYRNMLVFLAADVERLAELQQAVRHWLAWTSIKQEEEQLNLDVHQKTQVMRQTQNFDEAINARLLETFTHLIVPTQDGSNPVQMTVSRVQVGEKLVSSVSKKLKNEQQLITQWSPALLRMELDRWLWKEKDHINIKQLWQYFAQYPYLSRLRDESVLISAIQEGVGSTTWTDFFAYASMVSESGGYIGLTVGKIPNVTLDQASVIIKPDVANNQIKEDFAKHGQSPEYPDTDTSAKEGLKEGEVTTIQTGIDSDQKPHIYRRFHGTVGLDPARLGRDAGRISDEVLTHLTSLLGTTAKIELEIEIEVPDGIPEEKIRIINENCNTLKFKSSNFEEN